MSTNLSRILEDDAGRDRKDVYLCARQLAMLPAGQPQDQPIGIRARPSGLPWQTVLGRVTGA